MTVSKSTLFGCICASVLVITAGTLLFSSKKNQNTSEPAVTQHVVAQGSPVGNKQAEPDVKRAINAITMSENNTARNARVRAVIASEYGKVLEGLVGDYSVRQRLLELLTERTLVAYDANEIFSDLHAQGKGPPDLRTLIAQSQATIDEEIKQAAGDQLALKVQGLARAPEFLRELNQVFSPALEKANVPLSSDQTAKIALAMLSTYGSPKNPALAINQDNYDPASGLRKLDIAFLAEAARVLSPAQLEAYRSTLSKLNKTNTRVTSNKS